MTLAEQFIALFPGSTRKHLDCDPALQKFDADKQKVEIGSQAAQSPGPVSLQDWENHLAGRRRVGTAPNIDPDGSTCSWGVLDIDVPKEACEVAAKLAAKGVPALTWRSKSPGHIRIGLFAKAPVPCSQMKARLEDIRKYLGLAPGTEDYPRWEEFKPDGKAYPAVFFPYFKMTGGNEVSVRPDNTTMTALEFLAAAGSAAQEPGFFDQPMNLPAPTFEPAEPTTKAAKKPGRNNTLTQLAGRMRNIGMSLPEIRAALDIARVERFPGNEMPMEELEHTVLTSVAKWTQGTLPSVVDQIVHAAEAIYDANLEPMVWNVNNMIPAIGVAVLAARPKMGKSFLALQAALSVANGTKFLNQFETGSPRRVLYFGLEDSIRRINTRLRMLHSDAVARRNLDFRFTLRFNPEGFASLEANLSEAAAEGRPYSMVVIDTFLNAVLGRSGKMDPVRADYEEMRILSELAQKYKVGILLVHHSRKSVRGDDPGSLDVVLGTTGMTAASDSIILLSRKPATEDHEESRLMFVTGKDVDMPDALEMEFNPAEGGWSLLGVASHLHASKAKQEIFDLLEGQHTGMTPADMAKALGRKQDNIRQMLKKMRENDEVLKGEDDKYRLPQKQDKLPFSSATATEPPPAVFYELEEAA